MRNYLLDAGPADIDRLRRIAPTGAPVKWMRHSPGCFGSSHPQGYCTCGLVRALGGGREDAVVSMNDIRAWAARFTASLALGGWLVRPFYGFPGSRRLAGPFRVVRTGRVAAVLLRASQAVSRGLEDRVRPCRRRAGVKAVIGYLRQAWEHLRDVWYLGLLAVWAGLEAAFAVVEFVLHILRIPHWH